MSDIAAGKDQWVLEQLLKLRAEGTVPELADELDQLCTKLENHCTQMKRDSAHIKKQMEGLEAHLASCHRCASRRNESGRLTNTRQCRRLDKIAGQMKRDIDREKRSTQTSEWQGYHAKAQAIFEKLGMVPATEDPTVSGK